MNNHCLSLIPKLKIEKVYFEKLEKFIQSNEFWSYIDSHSTIPFLFIKV